MRETPAGQRSLVRLERIIDVVYALIIWRLFTFLPRVEFDQPPPPDLLAWLAAEWEPFVIVPLALVIVMVYWFQTNDMLGRLRGTNWLHGSLTVAQLFSVLVFLYAIRMGLTFENNPWERTIESVAAALVGITSLVSWRYAISERKLLAPEVSDDDVDRLSKRYLSEPLTAVITIPFAFMGPWLWELSWFLYPVIRYALNRKSRPRAPRREPTP